MKIQAVITEVKTTPDQGYRLKLDTQELSPEDSTKLFALKGKYLNLELEESDA